LLNDKNEVCVTGYNHKGQLGTSDTTDVVGFGKKCYPQSMKYCRWLRKPNYIAETEQATVCKGHAKSPDIHPFLKDAKAGCRKAGDCVAVMRQYGGGKCHYMWRVVHGLDPGWKHVPNGFKTQQLDAYEANQECLPDPCATNNGGCHSKRACTNNAGSAKCGDCPAGYTNDGAKGCKAPSSCKWTRKHSHYVVQGHVDDCPKSGTSSNLFADLEDAKAACLKAGDCVAVTIQNRQGDICHGKWRVVHAVKPEWKHLSGGITHHNMDAYEAAPECLSPCVTNNGGCHKARKCTTSAGGGATCGDCRTGYTNDGAKGCKATCQFTWTRKDSHFPTVSHGNCENGDVFVNLEDAKKACIDAGDCKVVATQKNLCDGKYRVVHSLIPGLKLYPNGLASHNIHAYEAKPDCAKPGG
jgi:hypothetical protein